jgi:hypothetical protein
MNGTKKKVKALIGGLLANDDAKVESLVRDLTNSIIPERSDIIIRALLDHLRGNTDV